MTSAKRCGLTWRGLPSKAAESISYDAAKLALNLLSAMFTFTEVASGNCTKPKNGCYNRLDQRKIHGIRRMFVFHHTNCMYSVHLLLSFSPSVHVNYKFPLSSTEEPGGRKSCRTSLTWNAGGLGPKLKKNWSSNLDSAISYYVSLSLPQAFHYCVLVNIYVKKRAVKSLILSYWLEPSRTPRDPILF